MRTTIDIPDVVYRQLRTRAASQGRSAKALILEAVEQLLKRHPRKPYRVTPPLVHSKQPGTMHLDNAKIYEIIGFP